MPAHLEPYQVSNKNFNKLLRIIKNFQFKSKFTRTITPLTTLVFFICRLQNSDDNFSNFSGVSLLSNLFLKIIKIYSIIN